MSANILEGFVKEAEFARANDLTVRSVSNDTATTACPGRNGAVKSGLVRRRRPARGC